MAIKFEANTVTKEFSGFKTASALQTGEKGPGFPYYVTILKAEHIPEVQEIFAKAFCNGEPLTRCLNIQYDDFKDFALDVATKAAEDGLSVVALNESGQVIGCTIGEDFADPVVPSNHYPKLLPIFTFLEELCRPFAARKYKKNGVYHIWITAVKDEYRGTKLSFLLNNACVNRGIEKQFRYIYCEFTSAVNENIMKFYPENVKINTLSFQDFEYEGQKPFAQLEGAAAGYVCTSTPYFKLENFEECIDLD